MQTIQHSTKWVTEGSSRLVKRPGQGANTHLHLVSTLWMSGATPLSPLYVFMAWTATTLSSSTFITSLPSHTLLTCWLGCNVPNLQLLDSRYKLQTKNWAVRVISVTLWLSSCPPDEWHNTIWFNIVSLLEFIYITHFCKHDNTFISVINQLNAQKFCFTISLFHVSTCFEHMCSSSGGQNCVTHL